MFKDLYLQFVAKGYFQESFGYFCVDAGDVAGTLGQDVEFYILRKLRKSDLWPIWEKYSEYSEDDVFDIIEFLYDYISKPVDGYNHTYNNCGWHYETFDANPGRQEYRTEINGLLQDYKEGYELSNDGEILALPDEGLTTLLEGNLPIYDPDNVDSRVKNAILKFRRHRSSLEDRRDALPRFMQQ